MSTTLIPHGMPVTPSERRLAQRQAALAKANDRRIRKAILLRRLSNLPAVESAQMAIEIVQDPPELLERMTVALLLEKMHRSGPTLARRLAAAAEVDGAKLLGALDDSERVRLSVALQMRARITKAA